MTVDATKAGEPASTAGSASGDAVTGSTLARGAHRYGERVELLGDAWTRSAIATMASPETDSLRMLSLVRSVYQRLAHVGFESVLPSRRSERTSRMAEAHPRAGRYTDELIDPKTRIVIVDVIRGGIVPAQVVFELLAPLLPRDAVRLDHLNISRVESPDGGVAGADLSGSKIGGPVEGSVVIFPDPMGATGSTLITALDHYREHHGRPAAVLALPMICTPEFLRALLPRYEELRVVTGRIDRGLSPPEVLAALPGEHWERERGLDERGYIVPGAGGVGELLNQSWC